MSDGTDYFDDYADSMTRYKQMSTADKWKGLRKFALSLVTSGYSRGADEFEAMLCQEFGPLLDAADDGPAECYDAQLALAGKRCGECPGCELLKQLEKFR